MDSEESERYSRSQAYPYIESSAGNEVCANENSRFCVTPFSCHVNCDPQLFFGPAPTQHGPNPGGTVPSDYAQVRPPQIMSPVATSQYKILEKGVPAIILRSIRVDSDAFVFLNMN